MWWWARLTGALRFMECAAALTRVCLPLLPWESRLVRLGIIGDCEQ